MKKIVFFLLLCSVQVFAQKEIIILDAITKNILPFAEMTIGNKGIYSNEKGYFRIENNIIQKGTVYYLGYEKCTVDLVKTDTILLKPKAMELDEIILSPEKFEKRIAFSHIDKRYYGSFPLAKKTEIITTIIPQNEIIVGKLKTVSFKFDKITFRKELYSDASKAFVRINIYQNDTILTKIYTSEPYEVKKTRKDLIQIDLSKNSIELPIEGLVFGVEYIGHVDKQGNFITNDKMVLRPVLTDENHQSYSQKTAMRKAITKRIFIPSITKLMIQQVDKSNLQYIKNKKTFTRNLAMSFVIIK